MPGPNTRRNFLLAGTSVLTATAAGLSRPGLALQRPQPEASPNAPRNQNVPAGLDGAPNAPLGKPAVREINAAQIVSMVQQLYQLASELKQETDHTNFKDTLPVDFIRRAQTIEKLAKSIRQHAAG